MPEQLPEDVRDLAASRKTVYRALETQGPLTQRQLMDWTGFTRRTVADAARDLEDLGYVGSFSHPSDKRIRGYYLTDDHDLITAIQSVKPDDEAAELPEK